MRIVWIAVMIPTGYASTALGEGLFRTVQTAMVTLAASPGLFVALAFAPRICAWLLAAVVSGLLMHAILRRRAGSASGQLYARFD
jgi:multidrug efflux pump subunit AcrB